MHRIRIRVAEEALGANETIARANREDFDRAGVAVVNVMSAPGAGKTTLLESALPGLRGIRVGVLEGDVQGSLDADRIAHLHVPVTQLNTDPGFGGECHLDANMVRSALSQVPLGEIDLLLIENVGNLVCPAEFRLGEDARMMLCAVTEGEDKPLKYPLMFRSCELICVNKIDLLPHLDVDLDRLLANIDTVNPQATVLTLSARTGEGVEAWRQWLAGVPARASAAAAGAATPAGDPAAAADDPATASGDSATPAGDPATAAGGPAPAAGDPTAGAGDPATGAGGPATPAGDPAPAAGDPAAAAA